MVNENYAKLSSIYLGSHLSYIRISQERKDDLIGVWQTDRELEDRATDRGSERESNGGRRERERRTKTDTDFHENGM